VLPGLAVSYLPCLQPLFDSVPLTTSDRMLMVPFFFASPITMELLEGVFRRQQRVLSTAAIA
jgi:Ca2+-transporting ATPase